MDLINARKKNKLTQEQLARKLGLAKSTISSWENGRSRPTIATGFKLAEILDSDIEVLFFDNKVQEPYTKESKNYE